MAKYSQLICDTNILVYFIEGNEKAGELFLNNEIIISTISYIEFLSNPKLTSAKKNPYVDFLESFTKIETNPVITSLAINMRLNYKLDTPDAIVASTSKYLQIPLVTADAQFFKIKEIEVIKFQK